MAIKVGDTVTYRTRPNAMALAGCKVVALEVECDNQPGALIDVGRFAPDGKPVAVLLEHLHLEPESEVTP